jgi:hypothetical protein
VDCEDKGLLVAELWDALCASEERQLERGAQQARELAALEAKVLELRRRLRWEIDRADELAGAAVSIEHPLPEPHHFDGDEPRLDCRLCQALAHPPGWAEALAAALERGSAASMGSRP